MGFPTDNVEFFTGTIAGRFFKVFGISNARRSISGVNRKILRK
jgi:hypothetical protein